MSTPSSRDSSEKVNNETNIEATQYSSNQKRILIMAGLYLAIFLVTLDQNIISTAIPKITDEFDSLNDVGWYGSAYILTMSSFQLFMGKVYKYYPTKPLFLAGCAIFEIGSVICGAAPNSNVFIVGRAIAGLGTSGLFSGLMVIMFHTIPTQQRPVYQGAFGAVFAVASVIGPLIGGIFTDRVTWRWCFYINLPIGAVSILVTVLILHLPHQRLDKPADGWLGKLKQLDPIGNLAFFPGIVCLILALQWGGTEYAWNDARIIVLFVLCGVLCLAFIGTQIWKNEEATIPPRIVKQRSMAGAAWFAFLNGGSMLVAMYYLPIWFQAIKGASATRSGIMLLPLILSMVFGSVSSGIIVSKVGYCTPFFYLSSIIMPIGAGLIATWDISTSSSKWIGYQILFGIGFGFGSQQPMNIVLTILDRSDISTGSAFVMFIRFLGSAIFVPVAQSIFLNSLVKNLSNLPGISAERVTSVGVTDIKNLVGGDMLRMLLTDYNDAIRDVFYMIAALCAACISGAVFVEWRSLKDRKDEQTDKSTASRAVKEEKEAA